MTKKVIETTNGWYMENEKEKVELEDIIGLVQTDEPTNSVEEIRKLRGRDTECEKLKKENKQLKQFINELTSRDGKIWLSSGYVYDVKKILRGDVE